MKTPCQGCPFNDGLTEEATYAQNLGCLPTPQDMLNIFDAYGEALSCHGNDREACRGLAQHRDVTQSPVLAYSEWYQGGPPDDTAPST